MMRPMLLALVLGLPLAACAHKGSLKTPALIAHEEKKKQKPAEEAAPAPAQETPAASQEEK